VNNCVKILGAALLATILLGCIYVDRSSDNVTWRAEQGKNRSIINGLELGSERQNVLMRMGTPDFSEAFTSKDGNYHVLYYRTQHHRSDGETTKDETTPLVFRDNKLIGWGQSTLNSLER